MVSTAGSLIDDVGWLMREISASVIEPRFAALGKGDVRFKSPGEVVTIADEEAEDVLRRGLSELIPDAVVIGEEATSVDPGLLSALSGERAWLVDPLDGTANFVAGSTCWAVMVALVERGETSVAWIWRPADGLLLVAERGSGATCNGVALTHFSRPRPVSDQRGAVLTRFLDEATADRVASNRHRFAQVTAGSKCTGVDYPMLVEGALDFVLYWRTLPWDHAPGVLIAQEAGACVRRLDGSHYRPDQTSNGLLAAGDVHTWRTTRDALLGQP